MEDTDQKLKSAIIYFSYPTFQFSSIPLFHWLSDGKHHTYGV